MQKSMYLGLCQKQWCPKSLNAGHSDKCDLIKCHTRLSRT